MPKEVHATTHNVTITKRVITTPAAQTVRIYRKEDGTSKDVFPIDAKEIVAQGEYTMEPVDTPTPTVGENVYKPVRPETVAGVDDDEDAGSTLRGPLPDDFPGRSYLETAGLGTYARLRKQVSKGEGWWKEVNGVGEKSYKTIEDALKEK